MDRAPLVVAEGRLPCARQVGHALVTVMIMMMMIREPVKKCGKFHTKVLQIKTSFKIKSNNT